MIKILLVSKDNYFIKLKVSGHSGYDTFDKDIVCAAVSSITQSLIIGLERVINPNFYSEVDDKKPSLFVDISTYNKEDLNKAQILFSTFRYTIESLILDYGKYISIRFMEEQL